jgi:N-acetylneuraminate synthase
MGIGASIAAVALGAVVIEKHFTLSRAAGGVDSAFSLEPNELKSLVEEANTAYLALGKSSIYINEAEEQSLKFKRSLYVVEDMRSGEVFSSKNVKSKRPSFGLHTRNYDSILGRKAAQDIKKGTPLSWNLIC